ncbi:hypothetical protein [uncultured Gammaproteobacteria bacterium]|uniref:hypothetical protein n=1 Tax=Bathymodiolus heckerae thiotrophic gill symbiont TaxID=1052212 RepID=UPI0010B37F2D|nr:hypothetical protein [Bathymodiolus heckerae thiotrophic gill symbiont]CAC9439679.1 hypothetical protein [uncultured Gammaproteobacteria bacterium]SMN13424.1 FIG00388565: hypothetical protein [Bathymodiolus heckerae thiotrophic gill symbiont]
MSKVNNIFKWDYHSDQPCVITNKAFKKQQKKQYLFEYLRMFLLFGLVFPMAFFWQFLGRFPKTKMQIGIGVNLDKGEEQYALVEELGVKHLLIRMPLWEIDRVDEFVQFAKNFGEDKVILINVLQDREHIKNLSLFKKSIQIIFDKFQGIATEYQIGNATNRTKWGFFSVSEYLRFYQIAQSVRDACFPQLKLLGSSVIDFEYYYTASALFNFKQVKFDKLSSLLYVDRRGAPDNRQYGFDLKNKINLLAAMLHLSAKSKNEIYITEVNWPLKNTAPFAPTSEKECVSELEYEQYMQNYINIVKKTQKISRLYWHQLIAPGYGLVDNRDGKIRKTPAFYEFKQLIKTI